MYNDVIEIIMGNRWTIIYIVNIEYKPRDTITALYFTYIEVFVPRIDIDQSAITDALKLHYRDQF